MAFSLIPRSEHFFDDFVQLSKEIRDGARLLKQMMSSDPPDMGKADAIKDIEHNCDGRTRAIVALFDEERDPITVIKWKEIFDFLEAATDRCEDVGNLLEGVVVKYS